MTYVDDVFELAYYILINSQCTLYLHNTYITLRRIIFPYYIIFSKSIKIQLVIMKYFT